MTAPNIIAEETKSLRVDLAARSYDIIIGAQLFERCARWLNPHLSRPFIALVTDETVARHQLMRVSKGLETGGIEARIIRLPAGEQTKSFCHLETLCNELLAAGVERNDVIIALGGGVIGDLTGFAAAILRRGCRFIQMPTSLLAQVDSSVGGKTAINTQYGKNLVGAFHQPALVLADITALETLPARELRAGYAEIVKYGLLGDAGFYDWLERNGAAMLAGDPDARMTAIHRACHAKARIVEEDEREGGQRALLNLGHTFAHALEARTGYDHRLLHGEAVALGMVLAFSFSVCEGLCPAPALARIVTHFRAIGLPTTLADITDLDTTPGALLAAMYQDKKVERGALTFILARDIGAAFIQKDVAPEKIRAFLQDLMA